MNNNKPQNVINNHITSNISNYNYITNMIHDINTLVNNFRKIFIKGETKKEIKKSIIEELGVEQKLYNMENTIKLFICAILITNGFKLCNDEETNKIKKMQYIDFIYSKIVDMPEYKKNCIINKINNKIIKLGFVKNNSKNINKNKMRVSIENLNNYIINIQKHFNGLNKLINSTLKNLSNLTNYESLEQEYIEEIKSKFISTNETISSISLNNKENTYLNENLIDIIKLLYNIKNFIINIRNNIDKNENIDEIDNRLFKILYTLIEENEIDKVYNISISINKLFDYKNLSNYSSNIYNVSFNKYNVSKNINNFIYITIANYYYKLILLKELMDEFDKPINNTKVSENIEKYFKSNYIINYKLSDNQPQMQFFIKLMSKIYALMGREVKEGMGQSGLIKGSNMFSRSPVPDYTKNLLGYLFYINGYLLGKWLNMYDYSNGKYLMNKLLKIGNNNYNIDKMDNNAFIKEGQKITYNRGLYSNKYITNFEKFYKLKNNSTNNKK